MLGAPIHPNTLEVTTMATDNHAKNPGEHIPAGAAVYLDADGLVTTTPNGASIGEAPVEAAPGDAYVLVTLAP